VTRARCPVDECDVEGEKKSVQPHVVHTSDEAHADLGADDVVFLEADQEGDDGDGDSVPPAVNDLSESKNGGEEPGSGDVNPGVDGGESGESASEKDANGESDAENMDDLERQREKLKNGDGGESKDGEETPRATDEGDDPSTTSSAGLPIGLPSFDTTTLLMLGALALVIVVGYLYLRSDDGESKDSEEPAGSSVDGIGDPDEGDESKDGVDAESINADDLEGGLTSE